MLTAAVAANVTGGTATTVEAGDTITCYWNGPALIVDDADDAEDTDFAAVSADVVLVPSAHTMLSVGGTEPTLLQNVDKSVWTLTLDATGGIPTIVVGDTLSPAEYTNDANGGVSVSPITDTSSTGSAAVAITGSF